MDGFGLFDTHQPHDSTMPAPRIVARRLRSLRLVTTTWRGLLFSCLGLLATAAPSPGQTQGKLAVGVDVSGKIASSDGTMVIPVPAFSGASVMGAKAGAGATA